MSTGAIIGVVIAILVLAAAAVAAQELRRAMLRRQFGPEYTRLAKELGQRKAEAELLARQKRAAKLNIRPLSAEQRTRYTSAWTSVQEQFVDNPAESVKTASGLVDRVMRDRGYPAGDGQQLIAALSVHHASKLDHYRRAVSTKSAASTEELREAILSYRELFKDLLASDGRLPRQFRIVQVLDTVRIPIGR